MLLLLYMIDRLNLEIFAISLPTHNHLRYSYIVTLEGVYDTRGLPVAPELPDSSRQSALTLFLLVRAVTFPIAS